MAVGIEKRWVEREEGPMIIGVKEKRMRRNGMKNEIRDGIIEIESRWRNTKETGVTGMTQAGIPK